MDFERKRREVEVGLEEENVDYLILTPGSNLSYLSGVDIELGERQFYLILSPDEEPFFFLNELMEEEVREESDIDRFEVWKDSENPVEELKELLDRDASKVLVEDMMPAMFTQELREIFSDADFGLASSLMENIRINKGEDEKERLRDSAKVVNKVIKDIRQNESSFIGKTEDELAEFIESKMKEYGGKEPSFGTIAASGPNGAKPHYTHGEKKIESGEPVVLDFGCYKNHYPSDQTRTLVLGGQPSEKFKEVHEVVRKAQQEAVEKVEPGVKAREVDEAARKVIRDAGYGEQFIHRTGHGVGLDVHEPPYINSENDKKLEEGMVFSVEPGIYIKGEFGVRIEDLVIVTEDGCERLNKTERGWN